MGVRPTGEEYLADDPGDCGNLFFFLIIIFFFQAEGDPDVNRKLVLNYGLIRRQINADYAKIVAEHPGLSDKAGELMLDEITNLDEPTFAQIDLRLYRPFEFSEKGQRGVFFQVFNLLNRENVGLIEGRVSSADFGRAITLAGPPRTVELGVRFAF